MKLLEVNTRKNRLIRKLKAALTKVIIESQWEWTHKYHERLKKKFEEAENEIAELIKAGHPEKYELYKMRIEEAEEARDRAENELEFQFAVCRATLEYKDKYYKLIAAIKINDPELLKHLEDE